MSVVKFWRGNKRAQTFTGYMVEVLSKDSFENQMRRAIFDPLGMNTATFTYEVDRHRWKEFAAPGVFDSKTGWSPINPDFLVNFVSICFCPFICSTVKNRV